MTAGGHLLRPATETDVDAVTELVRAAYEGYTALIGRTPIPMLADYRTAIRHHDVRVLEWNGEVAGILEMEVRPDHLWIENVAIAPAWQGQGLGRALLGHAVDVARERGMSEIRLLTNERYTANIAMYERYGYVETHREPHLGTDLVHFTRRLDSGGDGDGPMR